MITKTLKLEIFKPSGAMSAFGENQLVSAGFEWVAPVRLDFDIQNTTVRTDSGATHGAAAEMTAAVTILADPKTRIAFDDMLVVNGRKVRVIQKHLRYTTTGAEHHVEIRCTAWVAG